MTQLVKPANKRAEVRGWFESALPEIQKALPKHIDGQRLIRVALTACIQQPKLLDCTRESLMRCLLQSAQLGLEPDGLLGQAYLIAFNNNKTGRLEAQLMIGYQGKLELARRSKELSAVIPEVVHDKDEFEWSRGVKEDHFKHIPSDEDNPGPVTHAYCIVRRRDGTAAVTVLTAKQIERDHRAKSKSPNSPAWTGSYEEMCKKTLVHVGLKYEPKSVELARALASEDAIERGAEIALPDVIDVPSIPGIADESAQPPSALDSLAVDDEPAQAEPPTVPATPAEPEREPGEDDDFDPTTEKDNPFLRMQHALERENAKKEAK